MKKFLFTFQFHPATGWSKPYEAIDTIEAADGTAARAKFDLLWHRENL